MAQATARKKTATVNSTVTVSGADGWGHRKVTGDHANRAPAAARSSSTVTRTTATRSTQAASPPVTPPAWVVGGAMGRGPTAESPVTTPVTRSLARLTLVI